MAITPLNTIKKINTAVKISLGKIIAKIANTRKPIGAKDLKFIFISYIVKNQNHNPRLLVKQCHNKVLNNLS
jgi:hypothetical protein